MVTDTNQYGDDEGTARRARERAEKESRDKKERRDKQDTPPEARRSRFALKLPSQEAGLDNALDLARHPPIFYTTPSATKRIIP